MALDTFPKLLKRNYDKYGDRRIALREKTRGVWKGYSWEDYYNSVKYTSLGLVSLGLQRGGKVAILGETMTQGYWAELAAHAAGASAVGVFTDCAPFEVKYYMENSDSMFAIVHDQEQVDKFLTPYKDREGKEHPALKDDLPLLKKVIYWDPKGLWFYKDPVLISLDELMELGREYEKSHPGVFEDMVEKGQGGDIACIMYTSGTTGAPKGAMLSFNSMIWLSQSCTDLDNWNEKENYVGALPLAWIGEQNYGVGGNLVTARVTNFPEDAETVQQDLRELGPEIVFYGARQWESINRTIQAKMLDASAFKRLCYRLMLPIGYKLTDMTLAKEKHGLFWGLLGLLNHFLICRPLLDKVGLAKVRVAYMGGSGISPAMIRFLCSLGLDIRNMYGATETMLVSTHHSGEIKSESAGVPYNDVEIRISEQGEILVRTPAMFAGYYKNPGATEKRFDQHRWYKTEDFGYIDEDGHLIAMDRMVDVVPLSGGRSFSSQFIEVRLRFSPYVKDAISLGGADKDFVGVLIDIDIENVGRWAEARHIAYTTFADLSQKPEVVQLIRGEIQKVNRSMPETARIKRFANLHKSLDPDEAELTRTRKLRRGFIEERYGDLIAGIYGGVSEVEVEIPVTYRDGRTGVAKGKVKFIDVD